MVELKEIDLSREVDVEVQRLEKFPFELQQGLQSVAVVGDLHEIAQMRKVGLVVLAGQTERGNAEQLELLAWHGVVG